MGALGDKQAFILLLRILELVQESGANRREALSAIKGAEAMLPELELPPAPALVIET